jgi:hypothetical protein
MTVIAKTQARTRIVFDTKRYGKLLAEAVPVAIHSETECKQAITKIDNLLRKGCWIYFLL